MGILAVFRLGALYGIAFAAVLFFYKVLLWFLASYEVWILGGLIDPNQLYPVPSIFIFVLFAMGFAIASGLIALLFHSRLERVTY